MRKTHRTFWLLLLVGIGTPLLTDVLIQTDREAIESRVEEVCRALEAKDARAILHCVSADFHADAPEVRSKSAVELERVLERAFARIGTLRVNREKAEIDLQVVDASVKLQGTILVELTAGSIGMSGKVPFRVSVEAALKKSENDEWLFSSLRDLSLRPGL